MIRTVNGLIKAYYRKHPRGHYFDEGTLAFFGESVATMTLRGARETVTDMHGERHECYVLDKIQTEPFGVPKKVTAYFDVNTLDDIII